MSLLDFLSGKRHVPMPPNHPYLKNKRYRFSSEVDWDLWRGLDLYEQRKGARWRSRISDLFSCEELWDGVAAHVALAPGADWAVVRAARELFEHGADSQVHVHVFDKDGKEVVERAELKAILWSPEACYHG